MADDLDTFTHCTILDQPNRSQEREWVRLSYLNGFQVEVAAFDPINNPNANPDWYTVGEMADKAFCRVKLTYPFHYLVWRIKAHNALTDKFFQMHCDASYVGADRVLWSNYSAALMWRAPAPPSPVHGLRLGRLGHDFFELQWLAPSDMNRYFLAVFLVWVGSTVTPSFLNSLKNWEGDARIRRVGLAKRNLPSC